MSSYDHSLYVYKDKDDIIFVIIYVDNLITGGDTTEHIEEVKDMLEEKFKMKDLGGLHYFLGIKIICLVDGIWLAHYQYAVKLLKNFDMLDLKGISTPLEQNTSIGLIYLTITCPYLSYAMGFVSRLMQNPQKLHLDCVKRILRHVKFTTDFGVWYDALVLVGLSVVHRH